MLRLKRSALWAGLTGLLLLPLTACSNTPFAATLQRSFAPDPQLEESPVAIGTPRAAGTTTQLPGDFPSEIPQYPNAQLLEVVSPEQASDLSGAIAGETQVRWTTADSPQQVQAFYRDRLREAGWQVSDQANGLTAEQDGLQVEILTTSGEANTQFTIAYSRTNAPSSIATAPEAEPSPAPSTERSAEGFTDLEQAPAELRSYLTELTELTELKVSSTDGKFNPNQTITRREYARWLVAVNNEIFSDRPARQIRLAPAADQPAFQDVPKSDPDYGAIEGLAEAGLIPSTLTGDATTTTFRPDAPLTREDLIRWKVPVDLRQSLPNATVESVQQTWGFQDAARIEPRALRAVLADYQNGDLSNIRRAFGYTTLLQPKKPVTRAEAAAVLWYFGAQGDGVSAKDVLQGRSAPATGTQPEQTPEAENETEAEIR